MTDDRTYGQNPAFVWNAFKAAANVQKHGVSFPEATEVFNDPSSITDYDPDHSVIEDRWIVVGRSTRDRLLTVVFSEPDDKIRIISARRATKREQHDYKASQGRNA